MNTTLKKLYALLLVSLLVLNGCSSANSLTQTESAIETSAETEGKQPSISSGQTTLVELSSEEKDAILSAIPAYSGSPYEIVNNNIPFFSESDLTDVSFESYSELDALGRCGVAYACVGQDLMPDEERDNISSVKPTGWQTATYDSISTKYLYNRCHLLGYQLTGENANPENLITGTRYLNVDGMLPFENMIADYINETGNHVLYRVTPMFEGNDLVARGVLMEAISVEDGGDSILFNVYCYNVQPSIHIDYATGNSWKEGASAETETTSDLADVTYVLNTNSRKFHDPSCSGINSMSTQNRENFYGTRDELISQGYEPCGKCKP